MIGNAFGCVYLWSSEIYPTIVRLVDPWNSTFLTNEKRVALRLIKTNWSKMNASYVIQLMLYLDESGNYEEDSLIILTVMQPRKMFIAWLEKKP